VEFAPQVEFAPKKIVKLLGMRVEMYIYVGFGAFSWGDVKVGLALGYVVFEKGMGRAKRGERGSVTKAFQVSPPHMVIQNYLKKTGQTRNNSWI